MRNSKKLVDPIEAAAMLKALKAVRDYDGGGENIMQEKLCAICNGPANEHNDDCPMPMVIAAIRSVC